MTEAFSQIVGKLVSELELATDNLPFTIIDHYDNNCESYVESRCIASCICMVAYKQNFRDNYNRL